MTDVRYRLLLFIYVALISAAFASAYFATYSEALTIAYDDEPETWLTRNVWIGGGLLGGLLVVGLVGLAGLFLFKGWARPLSLYSTLAGVLITPFFGASVYSGLETALFDASATVWGAILALSYFSSVGDRFGR
jgi:hypothetical protein